MATTCTVIDVTYSWKFQIQTRRMNQLLIMKSTTLVNDTESADEHFTDAENNISFNHCVETDNTGNHRENINSTDQDCTGNRK